MNVPSLPTSPAEPVSTEGVVAAGAYVDGRRVANIAISEASSWRAKPGHVVWIGLHEPDMTLLGAVQKQFDLHELAIEDANHAHQRPKIEQYGEALFIESIVHRGSQPPRQPTAAFLRACGWMNVDKSTHRRESYLFAKLTDQLQLQPFIVTKFSTYCYI